MRIYLSATYRDLQIHRQAVLSVLRRMGHQVIGMEYYVAEDVRPLSRCLADVDGCDAYVGIFAWRYGSVPTVPAEVGSPPPTLPKSTTLGKTSITEFEFRQAIEKAKPVLLFLLDQEAVWPPNYMDAVTAEGEQGKAITRLRQELGQNHLVNYFRTAEELASLVSASIYRTEMGRQLDLKSINIEAGLNQPWVRSGSAPVNDSALATIQSAIVGPKELQALQIDVGQGLDWWMTRLYFLSSLAADLTSIEVMIFTGEESSFIGVINPQIVKERLLQLYPMLKPYKDKLAESGIAADLPAEVKRRADYWEQVIGPIEQSNPIWVTTRELQYWFSPYMITEAIDWDAGSVAALQMQRLLDWPMRFVPVVEKRRFTRVVDKYALTDQIARIFVREHVSRAVSTTL
jgi:hypothetical protein